MKTICNHTNVQNSTLKYFEILGTIWNIHNDFACTKKKHTFFVGYSFDYLLDLFTISNYWRT
jgi:hypothetical protein